MSKERELLIRACVFIDTHVGNNDCGIVSDIRSLLSQPNEEKLTMQQRLEEYKKGYARAEQDLKRKSLSSEVIIRLAKSFFCKESINTFGFARAIEKAHGIGVDNE